MSDLNFSDIVNSSPRSESRKRVKTNPANEISQIIELGDEKDQLMAKRKELKRKILINKEQLKELQGVKENLTSSEYGIEDNEDETEDIIVPHSGLLQLFMKYNTYPSHDMDSRLRYLHRVFPNLRLEVSSAFTKQVLVDVQIQRLNAFPRLVSKFKIRMIIDKKEEKLDEWSLVDHDFEIEDPQFVQKLNRKDPTKFLFGLHEYFEFYNERFDTFHRIITSFKDELQLLGFDAVDSDQQELKLLLHLIDEKSITITDSTLNLQINWRILFDDLDETFYDSISCNVTRKNEIFTHSGLDETLQTLLNYKSNYESLSIIVKSLFKL
ncbi:BA75_03263T0 [Komagataella pastoris]|uniref:BA75_03263T0 n=1 Tax=Komagataella pastoris TaxID=4922 RepID=A0A1B2JBD6_PICPA|nr:BA75_03263T0 [Komagataella pastoris]